MRRELFPPKSGVIGLTCRLALFLFPLAAAAGHPLTTDDPEVQGANRWQFELNSDRSMGRDALSRQAVNAALTLGISDQLDLAFTAPWLRAQTGSAPRRFTEGGGDASLSLKWRLPQSDSLSLALKPVLILPTAGSGLGNGRFNAGLTAIASRRFERVTLLGNATYQSNDNRIGDRKGLWSLSGALLVAVSGSLRTTVEAGSYRSSDSSSGKNPAFANAGLIWSPSDRMDLDLGYRRGLNGAESLRSFGTGLTLHW